MDRKTTKIKKDMIYVFEEIYHLLRNKHYFIPGNREMKKHSFCLFSRLVFCLLEK